MAKVARKPVPVAPVEETRQTTFDGLPASFKSRKAPVPAPAPNYPPDDPLGDLMAAEAMLDLLRLVHRARLAYAEALAVAMSASNPRRRG